MTTLQINRPWPEVKEKLLETEPMLSDADLDYDETDSAPLLERLAKKLGRSEEHVKGWIESVAFTDGHAG